MKSIRIISALLIVGMLLMLCPAFASETPDYETTGQFGEEIVWSFDGTVLTLKGEGATYDFEAGISNPSLPNAIWNKISVLIIDEGITHIGKNAFNGYFSLDEIRFPESLESIGEKAFAGTGVSELVFQKGCTVGSVGKEAFYDCGNLQKVNLSECKNLKATGEAAFAQCDELSYVYLPSDGVFSDIGTGSFSGCESLVNMIIPDTVLNIGASAFSECAALHFVQIPDSVESIGENAFAGSVPVVFASSDSYAAKSAANSNLMVVNSTHESPVIIRQGTLSNGITWNYDTAGTLTVSGNGEIEDFPSSLSAPWYRLADKGMTNLVIEEGITHIGRENFANLRMLENVTLPSTLKTIGMDAFIGCRNLKKIVLPEGFAGIGDSSLYACSSLKELYIPSSMYTIGGWALYGLDSVEKYTVSKSNTAFSSDENGVLYNGDKTALIKYPAGSELKEFRIPSTVKEIYPYAFDGCKYLEEVTFEENCSLEEIGYNTFSDSSVRRVILPESIKAIGEAAFDNCHGLEYIHLPQGLSEIRDGAFRWSAITSVKIPQSVSVIGNSVFYGCEKLEQIEIPEGVTTIGYTAFGCCESLREIYLPASISWIDSMAVYGTPIQKITVSEYNPYYSVDEYGALYFNKSQLFWYPEFSEHKSYTVPDGVSSIRQSAFENVKNLEEIILPETLSKIEPSTFLNCSALKSVRIPKGVEEIGAQAFMACQNLSELIFDDEAIITTIGARAFSACGSLKKVNIPDSVVRIDSGAFSGCQILESVNFSESSKLESISQGVFTGSHCVTVNAPEGSVAYSYAKNLEIHTPIKINVDGEPLLSDIPPVMINYRTMVPMRSVFEALGAEVSWIEETGSAVALKNGTEITVSVGSEEMTVNDDKIPLDSPAFLLADRTMIPLRAVSEAFGYEVSWDGESRTVDIYSR